MGATAEQRMASLERANFVRATNGRTRMDIRSLGRYEGRELVADLLAHFRDGDPLGAMPIRRLLLAIPYFGESKMRRYLMAAGVHSGDRRADQLSDRQRGLLADMLRGVT